MKNIFCAFYFVLFLKINTEKHQVKKKYIYIYFNQNDRNSMSIITNVLKVPVIM